MSCSPPRPPAAGWRRLNISQIGLQRATDPELKRFSQQMVEDHTQMNQELINVLAQKRIGIPQTIDARARFCAESLAGLSGEEFDKCYAKAQLVIHMDAVAMFEAEAKRGQDPDIKALAAKALPKIKEHLQDDQADRDEVREGEERGFVGHPGRAHEREPLILRPAAGTPAHCSAAPGLDASSRGGPADSILPRLTPRSATA